MKLVRYGNEGFERPGLIDDSRILRDLSQHIPDVSSSILSDSSLEKLRKIETGTLPKVEGMPRFATIPEHPILFLKANSAITGANDNVVMPRGSTHTDWEIELGVIIGSKAKYVSEEQALNHVAGYCIVNDVSERRFQNRLSGQWTKGKSCDTFGPIGPWLVTRDEIPDPQSLSMTLEVNGKRMQTGNTGTMIFTVAQIISHLSELMTLHPGDIISTGTPPGVGAGKKPNPIFLKQGDVMELQISGLGQQRQVISQDK